MMRAMSGSARLPPLTRVQWLLCLLAGIGFTFNQYEILIAPLIVRPVLTSLGGMTPGSAAYNTWAGLLFFVPAATGGAVGLLGGYLADRFGRRRMLVWSILLYSGSSAGAAYATSLTGFLILRCLTWTGVCVEFVAATSWLAELFHEPRRREQVLGYTQAFIGIGGLLVSGVYYLAVTYGGDLPPMRGGHEPWRYTLAFGVIPAVPLLLIRPFAPESPIWAAKRAAGTLRRPAFRELWHPALRSTTLAATVLVACCYALPYGAIQHTPRIVPGLRELRGASARAVEQTVSTVQMVQEAGALSGRVLFSLLVVRAVSRKRLLRWFLAPALGAFLWTYFSATTGSVLQVAAGVFVAALLFNGLLSFWGNYLPRVYPTHLRATGEGFATNIGGRIVGTSAALVTTQLASVLPGSDPAMRLSQAAGTVAVAACVLGLIGSTWLREPQGAGLPD
jgi:hypothetical protein